MTRKAATVACFGIMLCCWLSAVGGCSSAKTRSSVESHLRGAKICIDRVRRQVPRTEDFYGMQTMVDNLRRALVGLPRRITEKEKTGVEECVARAKTAIEFFGTIKAELEDMAHDQDDKLDKLDELESLVDKIAE